MQRVYLLTGRPGTGKTSLIKQMAAELRGKAGGFYTEEIRDTGGRLGFKLVTLDGQEAVLAHADFRSRYRVSRYGVDVDSLERVGVAALRRVAGECDLVIVEEIGKMELLSADFRQAVTETIGSGKRVLGTIMLAPHPWADALKRQQQVKLAEVTRANHPQVLDDLRRWVEEG